MEKAGRSFRNVAKMTLNRRIYSNMNTRRWDPSSLYPYRKAELAVSDGEEEHRREQPEDAREPDEQHKVRHMLVEEEPDDLGRAAAERDRAVELVCRAREVPTRAVA